MKSTDRAISKIATAATLIMLGSAISRLLGIAREQVVAGLFGTTATTSAFGTAVTVPTMFYDLLIGGAVSAALIPIFSEYALTDRQVLSRLASSVWTAAVLMLGVAAAVLIILAPQLVWLLGVTSPEAQAQTVLLVRIVLPSVVFLGLAAVTTALLYAMQEVVYPAFAVAFYNAGIIAAGVLLAPGLGATGLAIGVLIGSFCQLAFQIRGLRGFRFGLTLDFGHPALGRILKLYAPVALGLAISQVGVIIDRNLAWRTGEESVAIMRFATTLVQFPLGLIATATAFAVLPTLARNAIAVADGLASYKRTLALGIRLILVLILPATVGLVLLRVPIVQVLFQRGVFDARSTELTATAFLFYAPQLPFAAIDQLLIFAFYARKDTLTPAIVGLLGVGTYLFAGLLLIGPFGLHGLIVANSLQNSLHALVLLSLLHRKIGSLGGHGIGLTVGKTALATTAMTAAYYALDIWLPFRQDLPGSIATIAVSLTICGSVYLIVLALLRTAELEYVASLLRQRWQARGCHNIETG